MTENRYPRASDTSKMFTLKEFLETFQNIENENDKMLESDPNLKRSMAICKVIKTHFPGNVSYWKKVIALQTTLDTFFTKK